MENKIRMRTIRQALSEIKELDPSTAVTYNFLRNLCNSRKITTVNIGKKFLLNFDELLALLGYREIKNGYDS